MSVLMTDPARCTALTGLFATFLSPRPAQTDLANSSDSLDGRVEVTISTGAGPAH